MTQQPYYPQQPQGYPPQQPAAQPYPPQFPQAPQPPPQQYAPPMQQPYAQPGYPPQQGYGAPPPQAPPLAEGSLDAFYSQPSAGTGPSLGWTDSLKQPRPIGTTWIGTVARDVLNSDVQQQTDIVTGQPSTYRDGRPKFAMKVPLKGVVLVDQNGQQLPTPELSEGEGSWYVRGQSRDELTRAMAEAGSTGAPKAGAVIAITLVNRRPTGGGLNPANVVQVRYTGPQGGQGAAPVEQAPQQPPAQPIQPPVQQQASVQQPVQQGYPQEQYAAYAQQPAPGQPQQFAQAPVQQSPYAQPQAQQVPTPQQVPAPQQAPQGQPVQQGAPVPPPGLSEGAAALLNQLTGGAQPQQGQPAA